MIATEKTEARIAKLEEQLAAVDTELATVQDRIAASILEGRDTATLRAKGADLGAIVAAGPRARAQLAAELAKAQADEELELAAKDSAALAAHRAHLEALGQKVLSTAERLRTEIRELGLAAQAIPVEIPPKVSQRFGRAAERGAAVTSTRLFIAALLERGPGSLSGTLEGAVQEDLDSALLPAVHAVRERQARAAEGARA